jgi:hypothetical protein
MMPESKPAEFATVERQVRLVFQAAGPVPGSDEEREYRQSLSALLLLDEGRTLFVGGDETVGAQPSIERLLLQTDGSYAAHESFAVSSFVELPDPEPHKGRVGEIDIEGLDEDGNYLWLTGSHSCNRRRPKADSSVKKQIERLAEVELGKNRFFLARIPLRKDGETSVLVRRDGDRRAGRLTNDLLELLRDDPHLHPFLTAFESKNGDALLPGKDNGFDVEGLSVSQRSDGSTRLLLGLRGPVLRGFALVLEFCPLAEGKSEFALGPVPGAGGALYRKHFLDLEGLGVRDLGCYDGDLWILAGPTMAPSGPVALHRWREPFSGDTKGDTLTRNASCDAGGTLERQLLLPFGGGKDHAESFALLGSAGAVPREVLVLHDSPSKHRLHGDTEIHGDVFVLPRDT